MDDTYIAVGGATYKKMVGKKAYHYPITDEKRLVRRDYMRKWRYNKKKNAFGTNELEKYCDLKYHN